MKTKEQVLSELSKVKKDIAEAKNEAEQNHRFAYYIEQDIERLIIELNVLSWVLDNKE